jgi:hypothetical protein
VLVAQVLAKPSADFDRGAKPGTRMSDRERVVETLDHPMSPRQNLVPSPHQVVVYSLLFGGERAEVPCHFVAALFTACPPAIGRRQQGV